MSKGKPTLHVTLYTVAIILFLLFLFNPFIVSRWVALHPNEKTKEPNQPDPAYVWPESPGTFGDSYGALTSLFSFASFALLIYAFIREREERQYERKLLVNQAVSTKINERITRLPFFIVYYNPDIRLNRVSLINHGQDVYSVTVKWFYQNLTSFKEIPFFAAGTDDSLVIEEGKRPSVVWHLEIQCVAKDGEPLSMLFQLPPMGMEAWYAAEDRKLFISKLRGNYTKAFEQDAPI